MEASDRWSSGSSSPRAKTWNRSLCSLSTSCAASLLSSLVAFTGGAVLLPIAAGSVGICVGPDGGMAGDGCMGATVGAIGGAATEGAGGAAWAGGMAGGAACGRMGMG